MFTYDLIEKISQHQERLLGSKYEHYPWCESYILSFNSSQIPMHIWNSNLLASPFQSIMDQRRPLYSLLPHNHSNWWKKRKHLESKHLYSKSDELCNLIQTTSYLYTLLCCLFIGKAGTITPTPEVTVRIKVSVGWCNVYWVPTTLPGMTSVRWQLYDCAYPDVYVLRDSLALNPGMHLGQLLPLSVRKLRLLSPHAF